MRDGNAKIVADNNFSWRCEPQVTLPTEES